MGFICTFSALLREIKGEKKNVFWGKLYTQLLRSP